MGIMVRLTATINDALVFGGGVVPEDKLSALHCADIPKFRKELSKAITDMIEAEVQGRFQRVMIFTLERVPQTGVPLLIFPAPKTDLLDNLVAARKKEAH